MVVGLLEMNPAVMHLRGRWKLSCNGSVFSLSSPPPHTEQMLGAQTRFTLDQVKTTNAQLYSQIEKAATEKLEKKKQEAEGPLDGEKFKNRKIGGFINEQPMVFDLGASYDLTMKLCTWDANKISYEGTETLKDASSLASARLTEFLKTLDTPPPLPALIASLYLSLRPSPPLMTE
jgi:hypothetical protein